LASAGRRFPRRVCHGEAELCGDWLAIGFNVAGKPFEQPPLVGTQRSLRSDISLLTFGELAPRTEAGSSERQRRREAEQCGFVGEHWKMLDHSVNGFRLQRHPHHERLEHHQLVGIRPPDGERFLLGQVSWLMYRDDGMMEVGIHVLSGVPDVLGVRAFGLKGGSHVAYQQAFLLPAIAALNAVPSLVLPAGWFCPQRIIEVHDGKPRTWRLTGLLVRGTNFDQVSFEPVDASRSPDAHSESVR
jgi:hypothetical protein